MALRMVVCPTCDYTGAGSASMKGPTSAAGMCPDCLGHGEVTEEKRERLLARTAPLRALTVRNPYAWAIATGWKTVENRSRRTSHRGDIAIHAGAAWYRGAENDPQVVHAWWGGGVLGTGKVDPAELDRSFYRAVVAVADLHDCHVPTPGCCDSPWADPTAGAHWLLRNVSALRRPVPARGALGVWMLPPDVAHRVAEQTPLVPAGR